MSSTITHAASASLVAITFAHIRSYEAPYILAAVISASVIDLDHLFYIIRDREMYRRLGYRGNLHKARSIFHELIGLFTIGVSSSLLFFVDQRLARVIFIAFTLHLVQDWLLGQTSPFAPIDTTEIRFFSLTFRQKVLIDLIVLAVSGVSWILFLTAGH